MVSGPSHLLGAMNGLAKQAAERLEQRRIDSPGKEPDKRLGRKPLGQAENGLRGDARTCIEGHQTSVFADIGEGGAGTGFDHDEGTRDPGSLGKSAVIDGVERSPLTPSFNIGRGKIVDDIDAGRPRQRFAKSRPARRLALKADKGNGVTRERKTLKEVLDRIGAELDQLLLDLGETTGGNCLAEVLPLLGG